MDAIDLLEKRIAALELQVLPKNKDVELNKTQSIAELLIQTHTMIATALSCREIISSILEKLPVINEYLNPLYSENEIELAAKRQYVLELYPELKQTAELINKFTTLRPFTDSEKINNVSELTSKLDSLTVSNLTTYQESRAVTNKVLESLQQYNDITMSIKMLFAQLEQNVMEIELSLQPKLTIDD